MQKNMFIKTLLLIGCLFLSSCQGGQIIEVPGQTDKTTINDPINNSSYTSVSNDNENSNNTSSSEEPIEDREYTVCLTYNGEVATKETIRVDVTTIKVIFFNLNSRADEKVVSLDANGYAKVKGLDGDYAIHLSETPNGYTYDPNIYKCDFETYSTEIKLIKLNKLYGKGIDLYSNIYRMTKLGTYRFEFTEENQVLYAQYEPQTAGIFTIESLVDIYADNVNPTIYRYNGSVAYKDTEHPIVITDGGASRSGGYVTNIKNQVQLYKEELGSIFAYALKITVKDEVYPQYLDFRLSFVDEYIYVPPPVTVMEAKEANFKTPNYSNSYTYATLGTKVFDGRNFKYNEADGYWHRYDLNNPNYPDGWGPILTADITRASKYLEALNTIESAGNNALTINTGTEKFSYKTFIESSYASCCNSDGRCYVTMELKEFLQAFANSQVLFMDGNGFVETASNEYAAEQDQWLWACGYYNYL